MVAWPSRGFRSPHEGLVTIEFWPNRGGLIWTWWLEKRLLIGLLRWVLINMNFVLFGL
ncbi:hypothetical protein Pint_20718 [Pistacia integerrima]|uniref:Uncharacterized protein n=1 Tax=Pistacia integerrima TaxID=434235 RepID=A0ACC0XCT6_9ROSI|nr:hypothetical protein Pint_20718 [Pistacia integerrima]